MLVFVCPRILAMMSIGMPYSMASVAKVCRAVCVVRFFGILHRSAISFRYEFIFWLLGTGINLPFVFNRGSFLYFSNNRTGYANSGTRLSTEVFSRGLWIQIVLSLSTEKVLFSQIIDIGKCQSGEAAKGEHVPDSVEPVVGQLLRISVSSSSLVSGILTLVLSIFIL